MQEGAHDKGTHWKDGTDGFVRLSGILGEVVVTLISQSNV